MWGLFEIISKVRTSMMFDMMNAFSPVITVGDIINLTLISNIGNTITSVVLI